jgi:hypothetical protein
MTAGATSERVKRSYVTDLHRRMPRMLMDLERASTPSAPSAQHHDRTGHVVAVSITRLVIFGDPDAPPPGQATLPL